MKKLSLITICFLLTAMLNLASPTMLYAQTAPGYPGGEVQPQPTGMPEGSGGTSISGTGSELICRGDRDWSTFISATLGYNDFAEYWEDILVRYNSNICHYQDIDGLLTRLDKIREQIRKAFYVCANTTKLKDTYYKLEAELFFLRNYIDTDNGEFMVKNPDELRNQLKEYFVFNKGFFTTEKIDELFNEFEAKYSNRLEAYKNCKNPTWTELVNKWQDFKKNVLVLFVDPGSAPVIKAATKSIQKRWDRMARTSINEGRSFFGGFLDARINGLEPKQALEQIAGELEKNFPQGYTFEQLQVAKSEADAKFDYSQLEADSMNKYVTLYKEVSDTFTFETMARLENLDTIIKGTFPYQNQTMQCLQKINDKQC